MKKFFDFKNWPWWKWVLFILACVLGFYLLTFVLAVISGFAQAI